jgi:DNA (cytosine-5)-methyltransferase 1
VSFFSGALGLDLGLERAGLTPLALNEIDSSSLATIRANRAGVHLFDRDVRALTGSEVASVVGRRPFAVVGGPPCQSFSTAGRRRGLADTRGNVFLHFLTLAVALEPRYIVVENVRGLLSAPLIHRPHTLRGPGSAPLSEVERPGGALKQIVGMLEAAGYGVSFDLYNVANFGVPQSRERVLLIAGSGGRVVSHLVPSHVGRLETFRSAVSGLSSTGECAKFRAGRERFFSKLGEGQNWRDLSPALQKEALGRAYGSSGGRVGFCRRLAWDKPSPTLVTSPVMPATELGHPVELRPLSVNEYRRLQTFPDDWTVCGSLAAQYRQLGNAVPVEFGAAVGRHLIAFENGLISPNGDCAVKSRYKNTDHESWRKRMA